MPIFCVFRTPSNRQETAQSPFARNLVVAAVCPRNYQAVLNTDNFKGPKGDTGAVGSKGDKGDKGDRGVAGIGYSTCQRRQWSFNALINNENKTSVQNATLICEPGEFALTKYYYRTDEYSVDWSVKHILEDEVDSRFAGTTRTEEGTDTDGEILESVLDSDGFPIGYKFSEGGYYDTDELLTGSLSVSLQVNITCCRIGD